MSLLDALKRKVLGVEEPTVDPALAKQLSERGKQDQLSALRRAIGEENITPPAYIPTKTTTPAMLPYKEPDVEFKPEKKPVRPTEFKPTKTEALKRIGVGALDIGTEALDFIDGYVKRQPFRALKFATPLNPITQLKIPLNIKKEQEIKQKWTEAVTKVEQMGIDPYGDFKKAVDKLEQADFMQTREAWESASLKDKFTKFLPETTYNILPSVISSIGMYAINPGLGMTAIMGSAANDVKDMGVEYGMDEDSSETLGLVTGVAVGALDRIVPEEILSKPVKKQFIKGFVKKLMDYVIRGGKSGIKEAGTEVAQENIQMLAESTFRDDLGYDEYKTRSAMSAFGGLLGGTGMDVMVNFAREVQEGDIKLPAGLSIKEVVPYKEDGELTTKILKELEGKTMVSKQFISDLTKRADIKKPEKKVILETLESMPEGKKISAKEFAESVKVNLLPLKEVETDKWANYNKMSEELKGNIADSKSIYYESPIKTSAGKKHDFDTEYYFGHTRREDMSNKPESGVAGISGKYQPNISGVLTKVKSIIRRIIEIQSDLFQKNRLKDEANITTETVDSIARKEKIPYKKAFELQQQRRADEVAKLKQYDNPTAHFYMVRKEVAKAAKDGIEKLQFPTGETAMKIEGLGSTQMWVRMENGKYAGLGYEDSKLTIDTLRVGQEIAQSTQPSWIITEVLEDGKFKAIPKYEMDTYNNIVKKFGAGSEDEVSFWRQAENLIEQFDISGEVDKSNPIYKFYENTLGRYLQLKYNAKRITDEQGVEWYEVDIKPEHKGAVEAFKIEEDEVEMDITPEEAEDELKKLFPNDKDLRFLTDIAENLGKDVYGTYSNELITVLIDGGKVSSKALFHEAFHHYVRTYLTSKERKALYAEVAIKHGDELGGAYGEKRFGPEEWLARNAESYASGEKTFTGKILKFFREMLTKLRRFAGMKTKVADAYVTFLSGKGEKVGRGAFDRGAVQKSIRKKPFDDRFNALTPGQKAIYKNKLAKERKAGMKYEEAKLVAMDRAEQEAIKKEKMPKDLQKQILDEIDDGTGAKTAKEAGLETSKVISKTKEFDVISPELKKQITTFFRPGRKSTSRAFTLLGNKDTTVPMFDHIFTGWVNQGVDTIIEPYAGAFTLGTHALENAMKAGLKNYHANIFDVEKFILVRAIKNGKITGVQNAVRRSVQALSNEIYKQSESVKPVRKILDDFRKQHPGSFIGGNDFYSYIRNNPIGADITVYKDDYENWRKVYQGVYNELFKTEPKDAESAAMNALMRRLGQRGGVGQTMISNTSGFTSFENKVFGKYGMIQGLADIDRIFKKAKKYGTDIKIYNDDGVKMMESIQKKLMPWLGEKGATAALATQAASQRIGFYLDPPYVTSSDVYDNLENMGNFISGQKYVTSHSKLFQAVKGGAKVALTNDVHEEYITSVRDSIDNPKIYAYKEGKTPTSLITSSNTSPLVDEYLLKKQQRKGGREELSLVKAIAAEKDLNSMTVSRLKKHLKIENIKVATDEQLDKLIDELNKLEYGDTFLSPQQQKTLKKYLNPFNKPAELITRREFRKVWIGDRDVMHNMFIPAMYGKESQVLVKNIRDELFDAHLNMTRAYNKFREAFRIKLRDARKSTPGIKFINQDKNIVAHIQGEDVQLTKEEKDFATRLQRFYATSANTMTKEGRKRSNYFTHVKRGFLETWKEDGLIKAFKQIFADHDPKIDGAVWENLEHIVANQKFNPFSLPRLANIPYSTNLEKVVDAYARVYFTKKYLDPLMPRVNSIKSIVNLPKSRDFINQYAQSLAGRPLDMKEPAVLKRVINGLISYNYWRFLGMNWKAGLVNTAVGKFEAIIDQEIPNFLKGEKRFFTKKGQEMMRKYEVIDSDALEISVDLFGGLSGLFRAIVFFNMRGGGRVPWGENWIQGAQYLGELTDLEYVTGIVSEQRNREILNTIANIHGPYRIGHKPVIAKLTYGRVFTNFKLWMFGKIGSRIKRYRAAFGKDILKATWGSKTLNKAQRSTLKELVLISTLLWLMLDDEDEQESYIKTLLQELLQDMFGFVSLESWSWTFRTVGPTFGSMADILDFIESAVKMDVYKTHSKYGDPGDLKFIPKGIQLLPLKKPAAFFFEKLRKKTPTGKGGGVFAPKTKLPSFAPSKTSLPSFNP